MLLIHFSNLLKQLHYTTFTQKNTLIIKTFKKNLHFLILSFKKIEDNAKS